MTTGTRIESEGGVLTGDGRRAWATSTDPATMAALLEGEACGRKGVLDGAQKLELP